MMVRTRKNTGLKQIVINEYMKPCTVLKTVYETAACSSYLVSVTNAGGQEGLRFLQAFHGEDGALCRKAEAALVRVYGGEKIRRLNGSYGAEYLLIDLPSRLLQWTAVLKQPLPQRLETVLQLGNALVKLEEQGIVPDGIDVRTFTMQEDGSLCCWDLRNAAVAEETEALPRYRRRCAEDLARLTVQALTGKAVPGANCLTLLELALLDRMDVSDQAELLQLLDDYLHKQACTDLTPLLEAVELYSIPLAEGYTPKRTRNTDKSLVAANFLREKPLWKYVREGQNGEKRLSILLVGMSPMRRAFLDTIIPCAQMLDTQMHIRVVAEDAAAFCDRYLKNAPLLAQAARITHIPERPVRVYTLNEQLTGKDRQGNAAPLVDLTFEKRKFPDADTLKSFDPGCILLMEPVTEPLRQSLLELVATERRPLRIGLPELPRFEELQQLRSGVDMDAFSKGRGGELTQSAAYREALAVHTFYAKEDNERKSRAEILADFQDPYYRDSSMRSALTIPYKLAAYGLADCDDASDRFYDEVLQDEKRLRRLIWLEHRSWQAYLMVTGWTLDTENFEKDFIARKYLHKDKPWHACLFGSNDTESDPLADSWTMDDWDNRNTGSLDPLDKMSVTIHRLLAEHVEKTVNEALDKNLDKLKHRLLSWDYQQLNNAALSQKANVTNADVGWKRVMKEVRENLARNNPQNRKEIESLLDNVESQVAVVERRNQCRQYKALDRAILEAIPYLLEKDSVRCVYKLWADREHPWNNLASAFFVEPEQLCILTTEGQTVTQEQQNEILNFLQNRRGVETAISVLPLAELKKIRKGAVLDVTGVDTEQMVAVTKHLAQVGESVPMVQYKDGKLRLLDGKLPLLRFYRYRQTLMVEEMMAVTGTVVHSENELVPMQRMGNHATLWRAVQEVENYNIISSFLSSFKQVWKVFPGRKDWYVYAWSPACSKADAETLGLLPLLTALERACVIHPIRWQNPQVEATNPRCQKSLNDMLDAFRYADDATRRKLKLSFKSEDPEALCVLENQSESFNEQVEIRITKEKNEKEETVIKKQLLFKAGKNATMFVDLDTLIQGLDNLQSYGLIQRMKQKPFVQETTMTKIVNGMPTDEKVPAAHIRFQYADLPTMDCITKAGNALEALAYHTIRQMNVFDDVKLGVSILWGEQILPGTPTQNEIDLVCTKGTRSFFISCKKRREIAPEHINEIRYETDRFGVNGTAILLTTAPRETNAAAYARARRMGVEGITLKDTGKEDSGVVLRKRIREILDKTN